MFLNIAIKIGTIKIGNKIKTPKTIIYKLAKYTSILLLAPVYYLVD